MVATGRRTASNVRVCVAFARNMHRIRAGGGVRFLVLYLKACHVLVMQVAAGMKLPATQDLGVAVSRTRKGVPRIVPLLWRRRILEGDRLIIRITLSLLALYRVLEFPGCLNLKTITSPGLD